MISRRGTLLVISGPSGCGKGTVLKEYANKNDNVYISISATTRDPREGERYGINYYYLTREEFEKKIEEHGFLEHASFCGNFYGTPRKPVEDKLSEGVDVILEIDVQGAFQVKKNFPEAVLVFIMPPSFEELRARLTGRGTESADIVEKRLKAALKEIEQADKYDYVIVNEVVSVAAEEIKSIFDAEKCRAEKNKEFIKGVLDCVIS
jgi:guanylate kinase